MNFEPTDKGIEQIIPLMNDLQDVFQQFGQSHNFDLPQVIIPWIFMRFVLLAFSVNVKSL